VVVSKMELSELLRKADGADVDFLREGSAPWPGADGDHLHPESSQCQYRPLHVQLANNPGGGAAGPALGILVGQAGLAATTPQHLDQPPGRQATKEPQPQPWERRVLVASSHPEVAVQRDRRGEFAP
jgi:hypothetical protein